MPNSQNRNNRRKRGDHSETLIIPHITKDMLEKARSMAAQGASRAEIEQAILQMQTAKSASDNTAQPAAQPAPQQEPDIHRIIPTSRPRYTEEERKAMLEKMRQEQEQQEAARREEATRRTERPAWHFPRPEPVHRPFPHQEEQTAVQQPKPVVQNEQSTQVEAPPEPVVQEPVVQEEPTRTMEAVRPKQQPKETAAAKEEPAVQRSVQPAAQSGQKRHAGLLRSRNEAEAELNEKIRSDHVWLSNPVMVRGLGLAPVVGAALDGERALMLCVACLLLVTFTRVLAVAVCHISNNRFRPMIYCYAAALLYIPVYVLLYNLFGNDLTMLGIYLPILVVEPAIVKRMEFTELEPIRDAWRHGFNNGIGMCAALLIVGCLRELLATGAVFGHQLLQVQLFPLAAQPAGGFVLVGAIAAVWCAVANAYTDYKREEVRRLYADRKH